LERATNHTVVSPLTNLFSLKPLKAPLVNFLWPNCVSYRVANYTGDTPQIALQPLSTRPVHRDRERDHFAPPASCGYTRRAMKSRDVKTMNPKKRQLEVPAGGRVASSKKLQKMKSDSQSRDRKLVAKGGAVDQMFLIHPDLVKTAKIIWPADD
jgi:hypothetical protein